MHAVLEWHAQAYYPGESKTSYAEHYFSATKKHLDPPAHSPYAADLLDVYYSTIGQRGRDEFGCPDPLSASLLKDYIELCGYSVTPYDCRVLLECDRQYRGHVLDQCMKHRKWLDSKAPKK